ncbi:MAG: SDR family NAD(P)-dependent oxidoreductase [bacterium]
MRISSNTVAVVTGAACGIGKAVASDLATRGCQLALVDINESALEQTAAELSQTNRHVTTHATDVASESQMRELPSRVLREHGQIHLLVNNAGVSVASPFDQLDLQDFRWLMGVNFWGTVFGCKFFLPHLAAADCAAIVNIPAILLSWVFQQRHAMRPRGLQSAHSASHFGPSFTVHR